MSHSKAEFAVVQSAINGLSKIHSFTDNGMQDIIEVSLDLAESEGNENNLKDMEQIMAEYIAMETDFKAFTEVVVAIKEEISQLEGNEVPDIEELVKTKLKESSSLASAQDVENHQKMKELKEKLWEIQHPGGEIPPQPSMLEGDSDLQMTQSEINTKCPITKVEMTDPIQNKTCKHNYEKEAMMSLMKQRKTTRCPVVGCKNDSVIHPKDLEDNRGLRTYIERKNRQAGKKKK